MKILFAALYGILLGASATLLHILLFPLGILIGLAGTVIGIWAVGRNYRDRKYKVIAAIAWLYAVVQAATLGVGGELLVQGDLAGTLLLLGGTFSLVLAVVLPL